MIFGSVCSGIEAASVAWQPLGWRPAFFSEIEGFPRALLQHRFPDIPLHGDFTTIKEGDYESIDLLVGGTPCQDFSVAGLRAGLDGERGGLTIEFARLARRLRPRWLVWENVPGLLSIDGGRAFGAFLGLLGQCGYGFAYRVLDAQFAGVPQRRRRIFLVGYLGDWRPAAAVLFEPESLRGDPPPSREAGQKAAGSLTRRVDRGGANSEGGDDHLIAHALRADGFDASEDGTGRGTPLVAHALATSDGGVDREDRHTLVTGTINSNGKAAGSATQQDAESGLLVAFGGNNTAGPIEVASACRAKGGSGHGDFESETFVHVQEVADPLTSNEAKTHTHEGKNNFRTRNLTAFKRAQVGKPYDRSSYEPDKAGTLSGYDPECIAFTCKDSGQDAGDVAPTLRGMSEVEGNANAGGQLAVAFQASQSGMRLGESHPTLDSNNGSRRHHGAMVGSTVRRLTPVECERLQGLPDNWTLIPYRSKPAKDGPRYKAIGNSMAVPVVRWIGERIEAVHGILQSRNRKVAQ